MKTHSAHSDPRAFGGGRWGGCSSEPSPQQQRTLKVVACLTLAHGKAPTCRKLGSVLGCSRQAAQYRLHYLEKKGLWSARRWALTEAGVAATRPLIEDALAALQLSQSAA